MRCQLRVVRWRRESSSRERERSRGKEVQEKEREKKRERKRERERKSKREKERERQRQRQSRQNVSHDTHINEWHTYKWITSHTWQIHAVTHMTDSCRTRSFLEAGFRPLGSSFVWFVPLSRTKRAFFNSTRTILMSYLLGPSLLPGLGFRFNTRWVPTRFRAVRELESCDVEREQPRKGASHFTQMTVPFHFTNVIDLYIYMYA